MFVTLGNAKIDFKTAAGIWLFEEKDGDAIKDSSNNKNNGKADGTKHVAGKFGTALSLNGTTDKVTVPDSDTLDLPGAWTITAWIKVNKTEANWGHILGKRDPALTVANYAFRVDNVGKGWDTYFATNNAWKGIWNQAVAKKDEWVYMTATYDGKDVLSIYENGVQIGTGAAMGAPSPANAVDVIIGGYKDNTSELLDGALDEVVLLGSMITTDDMKTLMDKGVIRSFSIEKVGKLATCWGNVKVY
jgi:hypothetical protein